MNVDVENVFLNKRSKQKEKVSDAHQFLIHRDKILVSLTNLNEVDPITKKSTSNLLSVLKSILGEPLKNS